MRPDGNWTNLTHPAACLYTHLVSFVPFCGPHLSCFTLICITNLPSFFPYSIYRFTVAFRAKDMQPQWMAHFWWDHKLPYPNLDNKSSPLLQNFEKKKRKKTERTGRRWNTLQSLRWATSSKMKLWRPHPTTETGRATPTPTRNVGVSRVQSHYRDSTDRPTAGNWQMFVSAQRWWVGHPSPTAYTLRREISPSFSQPLSCSSSVLQNWLFGHIQRRIFLISHFTQGREASFSCHGSFHVRVASE